jgi:uncharacterized membrane protein YhhN
MVYQKIYGELLIIDGMKPSIKNLFIYFYLAAALVNIISHFTGIEWLQMVSKPMLMPLLLLWYLFNARDKGAPEFTLTLAALILSWLGDIALMLNNQGDQFFMIGLASFLLAHLFYIADFRYLRLPALVEHPRGYVNIRIIVLILAGSSLFYILQPNLGSMVWPVGLYTVVIIVMAISALLRKGRTTENSFISIYAGALLFVLSDSMIGITTFLTPMKMGSVIVMFTYIIAQLLIVRGIIQHNDPEPVEEAQ